ncbi:MAG TPA: metal ABC transporter ATP-binding protein [Verrucomicrobiae bacterium]|nr:metal ABC transporter ATP-binding protein [Verrucomicrobiae bacterium]
MVDSAHNILRFHDVTVCYGHRVAIDHVTINIPCGSLTTIVGPNGAGKSTLLRAILGWHALTTGEIRIGDTHTHHLLPRLAYLPQRHTVDWDFPITVRAVVEQGRYPSLRWFQRLSPHDHGIVDHALAELDITTLADRQIRMLSGGQQQRVFLARAVAQGADIFLLDEPFAGLDLHATDELAHVLRGWEAQGRTVLAVVHDLALARQHFTNAVLLHTHLVAAGPVAAALTPGNINEAFRGGACVHDEPLKLARTTNFPP